MLINVPALKYLAICTPLFFLAACGGSDGNNQSNTQVPTPEPTTVPSNFTLNFKAVSGDIAVNCDNANNNLGPDGTYSIGVTDLRFYVNNLKFYDASGNEIEPTLDDNSFQLNHEDGSVSLIDFTNTDSGFCEFAQEGTPRTNTQITGTVDENAIAGVSFDVGVPQALMKAVIAATDDVTDTPSPLAEMYWSWASGYRHFVINFVAMDASHTDMVENSGLHIGSKDCGNSSDPKALSDKDSCGLVNTPTVMLENFDPATNTVLVDLEALFANVQDSDFVSDAWTDFGDDDSVCIDERRNGNFCVTGQSFGIQCHSGANQAACVSLFPNFGLTMDSGAADNSSNIVFGIE